jgi:hypothetical protein
MTVYLPPGWIVATGLWIGVALLVALAIGIGVGKAIALGDEHDTTDDTTWLDDQPDEVRTDTDVIYFPREWVL